MLSRRFLLKSGAYAGAASLGLRIASGTAAPGAEAQGRAARTVTGRPLELHQVKTSGWLAERLDRAFIALDNLSAAVWWNVTDVWGYTLPALWLRDMVCFRQYSGTYSAQIEEFANRLIMMQAEGKLRLDYRENRLAVYEDGELIRGLLEYYRLSHDSRALEGARAVASIIEKNWQLIDHYYNGIAIGALLKLQEETGQEELVELATRIADREELRCLDMQEGTHGAAVCMILDGFLRLHEKTGEPRYLEWASEGWRAIHERMFVTGGIGEVLFFTKGAEESVLHDETCQTSWWFMFNLNLWRVTGKSKFLDLAEHILLNHFFFQQLHRGEGGGFHALGDIDQGFRGDHNYFCCDIEGPFGYLELVRHLYVCDAVRKIVNVNFFFESSARLEFQQGENVRLLQETAYPRRGSVEITVESPSRTEFDMRLRVPGWSRLGSVRVNGQLIPSRVEDSYVSIRRIWKSGDTVELVFPLSSRLETDNTGSGARSVEVEVNGKTRLAKRIGVLWGPVVMAVFRTGHNNDLSWVWTGDYPEILDSGGSVFEDYPGSKSHLLEQEGETFHSGHAAENIKVRAGHSVPTLRWSSKLGRTTSVECETKVLPGLPVTLEYREEVKGWNGRGRLLSSALRFATLKTNRCPRYAQRSNAWPYPFPVFTSLPDLSDVSNIVYQAGTFGRYESLEDEGELEKTGLVMLNNGYFRAIALYDPRGVEGVICRRTEQWVGVYVEPVPQEKVVFERRLVVPLHDRPLTQTFVKDVMERKRQTRADLLESGQLRMEGPVLEGAAVLIPKATGLKPGSLIHNANLASEVADYDSEHFMAFLDVPGTYSVRRA